MVRLNKKIVSVSILIFILILVSTIAYAQPFTDAFRSGLLDINSFFENEGYVPYAKTIDFVFFALLFISIYMMGARYAFKELKSPERVIVILLGLMTAFLLVLAGFSATILLPYIHWLLYFLLFLVIWWLLKGIKNPLWRFLLALLLTLLIIALVQGLFSYLKRPEIPNISVSRPELTGASGIWASMSRFFSNLADSFRGIDFGIQRPGVPDWASNLFGATGVTTPSGPSGLQQTTTPTTTTITTTATPQKGGLPWWAWVFIVLALAMAGVVGYKNREKIKGWFRRAQPTAAQTPTKERTIAEIIDEIVEIIKKKEEILDKVKEITATKKSNITDLYERYHKALKYDKAYWPDPNSESYKEFLAQEDVIRKLLALEFELEKKLRDLMEKENEIIGVGLKSGKVNQWFYALLEYDKERTKEIIEELKRIEREDPLLFLDKVKASITNLLGKYSKDFPQWYIDAIVRSTNQLSNIITTCWSARRMIGHYFLIGKDGAEREKKWKKLINIKNLIKWIKNYDKWKGINNINPDSIKSHFEKEEKFFNEQFKPAVLKEMQQMYLLIRYLKYLQSKREQFTEMQPLRVRMVNPAAPTAEWTDVTETATDPARGILAGWPFKIYTRLSTGIGPFVLGCYIDGVVVKDQQGKPKTNPIEKTDTEPHPVIEWHSNDFNRSLLPGEHIITFYLIGPKPKSLEEVKSTGPIAEKWRDLKGIKIYIKKV